MIETYKLSQINEAAARVASGRARYRVVMETDKI
jgi:D-arabinose 1-dehydrogenase-like Zn-dependent alcohol dehydrogenase